MYKLPKSSHLEYHFLTQYKRLKNGHALPTEEYKFLENRRFRFDFAWTKQKVAVEIEGSVWTNGRHTRGSGYSMDCEKYNLAVENGWRVLRYTEPMLASDPAGIIKQVITVLGR